MPTPVALWSASNGLCICCAKPVSEWGSFTTRGGMPTVDHVFPRSAAGKSIRKIRAFYDLFPGMFKNRRTAIAHSKCNNRKSNRAPTGCEVIFLMAVNARLDAVIAALDAPRPGGNHWGATANERTKARAARRKLSKERRAHTAKMQAFVNG